ncbi:MAG: TMEM14 family protein [Chlamydiales bacterium]|nr:TMEM14 family protein [Chlamydiales bacterium]
MKWILSIYSAILLAGGIFGYMEKGSQISLYMAIAMSSLTMLFTYLLAKKKISPTVILWLTGGFTGVFIVRYMLTGKLVPALFALISLAVFIVSQRLRGHLSDAV